MAPVTRHRRNWPHGRKPARNRADVMADAERALVKGPHADTARGWDR